MGATGLRADHRQEPQGVATDDRAGARTQNNRAASGPSLGAALAKLFPGFQADIGDVVGNTPVDNGTDTPTPTDETPADLLDQAETLFAEADKALEDRDLATYAAKVDEARALVRRALDALPQG